MEGTNNTGCDILWLVFLAGGNYIYKFLTTSQLVTLKALLATFILEFCKRLSCIVG